jgi:two-component sensor histidine kinase
MAALDSAIGRVRAVAEAHRALHQSHDLTTIAFDQMLRDLCSHTGELSPTVAISCSAEENLEVDAERAIPLGLIVSELLTNAARHAYPEGASGTIEARARRTPGWLEVSVTDRGSGIDPATAASRTLGTTIVQALARQIGLEMQTVSAPGQGTSITLRLRTGD